MKVGLITFHSFSQPGGVKRHVLGLHEEFKKRGIESKIIVPRRSLSEDYGKDVLLLGTSLPMNFNGSQADFDIHFNPLAIEEVLREEKFDVLHFHNLGLPSSLQIVLSPSALKTLNILTFHADIRGSKFLKSFPSVISFLNKLCQWKADGVIGVAPMILKIFKDFKGLKTVIPNGIDLSEFNPKNPKIGKFTVSKKNKKINILFVGRMEKRKGLIYLLKAYEILEKEFNNLSLIIVGDGDLKERYQQFVKDHNLKEVYFEGEVPTRDLPSYYASCDIFCSPAIFGESFGIVLLEAMASGKPLVAFANPGYKDVLKGKKGEKFLVKPKDYIGLAEKLGILIKDPKLRKEIGKQSLKEVKEYSWPDVAGRVLDFYRVCLENKKDKKVEDSPFDKIVDKVDDIFNGDISTWLK